MASKDFDDDWHPYIARGDGLVLDTCEIGTGSDCYAGGDSWHPNDEYGTVNNLGYLDLQGLTTTGLVIGLVCRQNSFHMCSNGSMVTRADAAIYSAFFTIADPSLPSIGTPTGDGWTTDAWVEGTLPLALPSSDNTGISATRVYADGSLIATLQGTCSYDRPVPCSDETTGAVGLPTAVLSDGSHHIELGAVDAAGNESRVERPTPLRVDNRAPAAPVGLASPAPTASSNRFSATWSLPADQGTPIVAARYQLCQAGSCGPATDASSLTAVTDLALPAPGDATLRVWLVDERGHAGPEDAATLPLSYQPPPAVDQAPLPVPPSPDPLVDPPPGTTLTPRPTAPSKHAATLALTTTRRVGRRITIAGTMTPRAATGRVTVRYETRIGGRKRTTERRVTLRKGRFSLMLTLSQTLARSRSGTIVATYGGDARIRSASRRATLRLPY
ncbi:MAG TPA: hypothetical protein VGO71_03445 [Baekduia sp.]|nr:hypothetical protein [Baekduia sp.]